MSNSPPGSRAFLLSSITNWPTASSTGWGVGVASAKGGGALWPLALVGVSPGSVPGQGEDASQNMSSLASTNTCHLLLTVPRSRWQESLSLPTGKSAEWGKVTQLCSTLCDPMDCTVHGILKARILEWVAFPFSSSDIFSNIVQGESRSVVSDQQEKPRLRKEKWVTYQGHIAHGWLSWP